MSLSTTSKCFLNPSGVGDPTTSLPEQPIPAPDHSLGEVFPNVQPDVGKVKLHNLTTPENTAVKTGMTCD